MKHYAVFQMPETINYGRGAFQTIGKEASLRGRRALVISDPVMDKLGYVNEGRKYLTESNMESVVYSGVESEPTDVYVTEALQLFRTKQCDVVISLGGGSCIDTAKAVAVLASNEGYIGDYRGGKKTVNVKPAPHLAVPTTAGTGSEATDVTVITNTTDDVKMMIKQPAFMPDVAIVDPALTLSSPKHVTAATGIDALSHAIEAYVSKKSHPMADSMALSAMNLIVQHLKTAYREGDNLDAREAMSLAAMQAGIAFSNASVCLVHGMSRPIGALFHVPHGYSNAMLLPAVLEFSRKEAVDRLADVGRIFSPGGLSSNEQAADHAVSSVKELCRELHIPNLKEWGIDKQEFESVISKMSADAWDSGSPASNPRVPTLYEMEELYSVCYDYDFSQMSPVVRKRG
ncbi:iron-containing alcohol dehydrogenase [Halobacillus litoralis]|uniref:Iron-containing alcohol dehydrogenase n=1 Tax=Halobacillus litoralis TaxID=45668 RepID=A0A845DQ25_9BACI|nr:iron-containing alcohol dehydrogenase [Halobacillus litoralis]